MAEAAELVIDGVPVRFQRSARRRRTIQARREPGGGVVVMVPQGLSAAEERRWAAQLVPRVVARGQRRRHPRTDAELVERARVLAERHLDPVVGRPVRPASIRWVSNQNQRWGSCTPATGDIRLSDRLQAFPDYVVDHVIVHELAHLVEVNHTPRFHSLVATHPQTERAKGFLEGWSAAVTGPGGDDAPTDSSDLDVD